jgi:hypothetical protein
MTCIGTALRTAQDLEVLRAGRRRAPSPAGQLQVATALGVTVWSYDREGPPRRLSRQGPAVLRWAVYGAGKAHAVG